MNTNSSYLKTFMVSLHIKMFTISALNAAEPSGRAVKDESLRPRARCD